MAKETLNIGKAAKSETAKKKNAQVSWEFPFNKQNFILLALGLGVIILGYLLMATGISSEQALTEGTPWNNPMANTVAPLLLFIGYCVLIPFAIVKYYGKSKENKEGQAN
jgi:hypothetical protein